MNNKSGSFNPIIAGTGSYLPKKTLTNDDLSKIVETNDEWITTRTGIKTRRIAADNESTATLAAQAAKNAIADAGITPEQVDMIIVATVTPEMVFPSTACFVQDAIGAKNAWAFDLSAACSGFVYGLSIAEQFIKSGKYENILVIGAETLSKITNYKDRGSCILFGDGSGAAIVQRGTGKARGIIYSKTISDGSGWGALKCEAYGSRNPVSRELANPDMIYMNINGKEVYQLAVRNIVDIVTESVAACNLSISDVDLFIPHQMNARIIESSAKRLGLDEDKVFINIEKYGNTSAASIPIAMDEAKRQGRIKSGDIVILVAFGGGLTWGANVIEF